MMANEIGAVRQTGHSSSKPGWLAAAVYSLLLVFVDVTMQTVAFTLRHFNTTKHFPFNTASIVFVVELSKCLFCYIVFCVRHRRVRFMPSPVFLVPAFFLVAANSAFFYCMNYIAPPTWNVFLQSRAVFTALGSCVIFARPMGRRTWLAVAPLIVAATLAVFYSPEVVKSKFHPYEGDKKMWVFTAFIGVASSVFLYDSAEHISKLCKRPLAERHIQLYFFSTAISFTVAEFTTSGNVFEVRMFFPFDFYMCVLTLIVWGFGGLGIFLLVDRLPSSDDGAAGVITACSPPVLFLTSTAVSSLMFPTQPGYSYGVTAVIVVVSATVSLLHSTGGGLKMAPEQNKVAVVFDA